MNPSDFVFRYESAESSVYLDMDVFGLWTEIHSDREIIEKLT